MSCHTSLPNEDLPANVILANLWLSKLQVAHLIITLNPEPKLQVALLMITSVGGFLPEW